MHRVLVVGVGSIGERHLRCFRATGRVEASFVEINPALRDTIAQRYEGARAFASLEEALAAHSTSPFDSAVICTPAPFHIPQARQLVEAGAHVLIEKPLSTSFDGIDALRDAIERKQRVAAVAYVLRCHPVLASMRAALHSGRWGRIVEVIAVSGQHFPTYRPAYREIYYTDRAKGGGAIQDALTHLVNAGEWIAGPIDRLVVDAAHQVLAGVEVEDTVHMLARHGQVLASYALNQYQAPNETTLTVVAERGTARCEFHNHRWRWQETPGADWHDEPISPLERDSLFVAQAHAFLDAIANHSTPRCTLAEGLQTLRVNLAALRSTESRAWESTSSISTSSTSHLPGR